MKKRYSIFVSSVADALPYTKVVAVESILSLGHYPVEMKFFPASTKKNFRLISELIDGCDYLIVIVAGLYGSGFVSREHNYALKHGIPVIAFVHNVPTNLPDEQREKTKAKQEKLDRFIKKLKKNAYASYVDESTLSRRILSSIQTLINEEPRRGWIRDIMEPGGVIDSIPESVQLYYSRKIIDEHYPMEFTDSHGYLQEDLRFDIFVRAIIWILEHEVREVDRSYYFEENELELKNFEPETGAYMYVRISQMIQEISYETGLIYWPIQDFLNKISVMKALGIVKSQLHCGKLYLGELAVSIGRMWPGFLIDYGVEEFDGIMQRSRNQPVPQLDYEEMERLEI